MIFLADAVHTLSGTAAEYGRYALLALGLGFVVFFHELGHFLAAKYCDVKVEQFAVGFGPAIVAWRKGIGLRKGTTTPEMEKRVEAKLQTQGEEEKTASPQEVSQALHELGLGETEYRLNWIPLGGYVKMLGQDDLNVDCQSRDPRSFNNKSIRGRMLIISAGVLMNVLLAWIGFMIVFLIGFRAPPPVVGGVLNGSPASFAQRDDGTRHPLATGDRIVYFDGDYQHGFTSVALTVALAPAGKSLSMLVRHPDGTEETLHVTPVLADPQAGGLLQLGVLPPVELRGADAAGDSDVELSDRKLFAPDVSAVSPGQTVTAINGQPVALDQAWKLTQALADSDGQPLTLSVRSADGAVSERRIWPHFQAGFAPGDLSLAGMIPRARVDAVASAKSPAYGKVLPDDAIVALKPSGVAELNNPTPQALRDAINAAGQDNKPIVLTLLDPSGVSRQTTPIVPNISVGDGRRGLNVQLGVDEQHTVVAGIDPDSPANKAGIKADWVITKIGDQPVSNWFQIRHALASATAGQALAIEATTPTGPARAQLVLAQAQIDNARFLVVTTDLMGGLHERIEIRKTTNPLVAAEWGAAETRDFILQFYVTLHRMFGGSVSYKEVMGPVGIVRMGAMSATRGADWLVWFLAMISANLAVANFLPIPVMDGGLFTLLILESIQGRPLSIKTQQVIQFVGLAIILSIFLLVTYQDITRSFGHG